MNMMKIDHPRNTAGPLASASGKDTPAPIELRVRVSELLAGTRQAILEHNGQDYRLRITSNGKLILTK